MQIRKHIFSFLFIPVAVILSIAISSCEDLGFDFNEELPNPIVTSEELKIYGLVLDEIDTDLLFVIKDTTIVDTISKEFIDFVWFIEAYSKLQKETYDEFMNPNSKRRIFNNLPSSSKHKIVLNSKHVWRDRDPKVYGRIIFSTIGFNKQRTQALLSINCRYGGWSGSGWDVVLEKQNNSWKVVGNINNWVN